VRFGLAILVCAALAQPQTRFLSADIGPSKDLRESRGRFLPNGDVAVLNTTLKELISVAYEAQEGTISGATGWMESEHYDLIARAPANTPMNTLRLMLRPLLAERFKLAIHTEQRTMPVLALIVAKTSPKRRSSSGTAAESCQWIGSVPQSMQRDCHNLTMRDLASQLPSWSKTKLGRPVVDQTGLKGAFDFTLDWREPGMTTAEALDQIGLKLEERQSAVPVVVIDRAERIGPARSR
jgi:uncharacterized protein (TIGR03435 family)